MLSLFEPSSFFGQSNFNSAMKLSSCTIGCMERLVKLQIDAVNDALKESSTAFTTILSKPGAVNLLEYWQSAYQANIEKSMEYGRRCATEITKTQTEAAQLIGELTTSLNKDALRSLEDLTRSAIEETEKATRVVEHPSKSKRAI